MTPPIHSGIVLNIYQGTVPNNAGRPYPIPGPAPLQCPAGGNPVPTSNPAPTQTQAPTVPSQPANGAALYGQCGGQGWSGPTTCSQGTCSPINDWYSEWFAAVIEMNLMLNLVYRPVRSLNLKSSASNTYLGPPRHSCLSLFLSSYLYCLANIHIITNSSPYVMVTSKVKGVTQAWKRNESSEHNHLHPQYNEKRTRFESVHHQSRSYRTNLQRIRIVHL
jgi:hypothetical protein